MINYLFEKLVLKLNMLVFDKKLKDKTIVLDNICYKSVSFISG
ncbi:hypothetical protein M23134_02626 [Microscilla marina ATCC 23134]|uniref:Uncharacterized protein n=1 Tax=Microscilla marina ATCC 23134 TaxID=313606 RepID=A1ZNR8_MICM2|nr:hypothetical protein M23134_02626 [Microscilla marina ATCC 23134]